MITFVTGPVRAGKSAFAEKLASVSGRSVVYVATAQWDPSDAEWTARIAHHRERRPCEWQLIETGSGGALPLQAYLRQAPADACLLVDSLGTWLADEMHVHRAHPERLAESVEEVFTSLCDCSAQVICVGEETGWGIVPDYPAGRLFRDHLGRLQARLAQCAERAYLVVSGYAVDLKVVGKPIS